MTTFDCDWLVIGSGFGGSVAALRLTEKGYRVVVLEAGRRHADADHAESSWQLSRFLWQPNMGWHGILRMTPLRDAFVLSGAAVGGGSTVYSNTLYRPGPAFYRHPQWAGLADWSAMLAPHFAAAERMLGVQTAPFTSGAGRMLRDLAGHYGQAATCTATPCAVYFGTPGITVPDPYFQGRGPERTGCTRCGGCMLGCRIGAKNTLLKNYLWFAERQGARIEPDCEAIAVTPLDGADGATGYAVTSRRPGLFRRHGKRVWRARGVVVAGGALGSNQLLARCRDRGWLPRLSGRLGELVRTNSESLLAVTRLPETLRPAYDVAISASFYPRPDTHLEFVTYGDRGDLASLFFTVLTPGAPNRARVWQWLTSWLRHPWHGLRTVWPRGWSRRSLVLLVMQSLDNALRLRLRRTWWGGDRLASQQDLARPNPTYIALGNDAAAVAARHTGGQAQSFLLEALADIPATAHLLGGVTIGASAQEGVVDDALRAYGYRNLLVCDGSVLPANPGVNPSLTITALAEHAMSRVPPAVEPPAA
jgi:cholesterol oxidase